MNTRLDTDFALSPDPGPFSPFVAGLTRAERDALLIELVRLFQNQGSNKYTQKSAEVDEASISRHLQNLHWKHEPASFLKSALKCEPAWIAPWLSTTIGNDKIHTVHSHATVDSNSGVDVIIRRWRRTAAGS